MTKRFINYGFLVSASTVPLVAYSSVYLTDEQATKIFFPSESFKHANVDLTSDESAKIESLSNERVRDKVLSLWIGKNKNIVFVDQVIGKHEFITLAVGIDKMGKVRGIEILEYRETYGYQVREESWRKQFIGKDKSAQFKVKGDITNISGATLSTTHITAAVKRIIQTYETVKNRI